MEGRDIVLEDYQVKYLLNDSTFNITNKSRQTGGSLMLAMKKFHKALTTPDYRCDIVSINLREATDKVAYIRKLHDTLPARYKLKLTTDSATAIGFHTGSRKSIISSIAASSGIRGGRKDIVFDEAAHIPNFTELFYAGGPAILNGDKVLDIVSTPRGNLDLFSKMWHNEPDAQGEHLYSIFDRHQFIWLDSARFSNDYVGVQYAWYVEARQNMAYMPQIVQQYGNDKIKFFYSLFPYRQFQQEFCGVFLDDSESFFPQALIDQCLHYPTHTGQNPDGTIEEQPEPLDRWFAREEGNTNAIFMGVDFGESAETSDKTSIQILERTASGVLMQRYSEVLKKDDYPDFPSQVTHIINVANKFQPTQIACDETGLGRGIVPLLKKQAPHLPIKGTTFTYVNKEEMVMNLKSLMERKMIWLLGNDTALHGEMHSIQRKLTESGRATYKGQPHDDMFFALCLAAQEGGYRPFSMFTVGGRVRL